MRADEIDSQHYLNNAKVFKGRSKGAAHNHKPKHLKPLPRDFVMKAVSELPSRVDWRESNVVSPVKDQGGCGSCWAFSSVAVLESHVAKATGFLFELSVQQVHLPSLYENIVSPSQLMSFGPSCCHYVAGLRR